MVMIVANTVCIACYSQPPPDEDSREEFRESQLWIDIVSRVFMGIFVVEVSMGQGRTGEEGARGGGSVDELQSGRGGDGAHSPASRHTLHTTIHHPRSITRHASPTHNPPAQMTLKLIAGGTANMSFIMIAECMIVFSAAAVEVVIWSSDVWESIKYLDDDGFEYEGENFEKATTKEVIVNIGKVRWLG